MKLKIVLFLFILQATVVHANESPVVLSEVMFDPSGNESYDEYAEIFNTSFTDSVDLNGWHVGDNSELDNILPKDQDTVLKPRQFGLILDSGYFGNSDSYDPLPESAIILTIDDASFGRSGWSNSVPRPVILVDSRGDTVAQYIYSIGNKSGLSDEKIILNADDTPRNWADSKTTGGSPGRLNSVSPLPSDIAILGSSVKISPDKVSPGSSVQISATVLNIGEKPVSGIRITLFQSTDSDTTFEQKEIIDTQLIDQTLLAGDSLTVSFVWGNSRSGLHILYLRADLENDGDTSNNTVLFTVPVAFRPGDIVINEIDFDPSPRGSEWIELFNRAQMPVDLNDWALTDSDSSSVALLSRKPFILQSNGYLVVAADSISFFRQFPSFNKAIIFLKNQWPSLNNEGDAVILRDPTEAVIDSVFYRKSWVKRENVSIERINPDLGSNDPYNWSSYTLDGEGSPGTSNSVFTSVLPTGTDISISPNPFDKRTVISYHLPAETATVSLRIYDSEGHLVRKLLDATPSGSQRSTVWDGCDDSGERLRVGIYVVYLEGLNERRGVVFREKKAVVLAKKL